MAAVQRLKVKTEPQSPELSEIWLAKLMDETVSNWPNQQISETTVRMWRSLWEEMVSEYGAEEFQNALWRLCQRSKFCPVPGEIRDELASHRRTETRPQYQLPAAKMAPPTDPVSPEQYQEFKTKFSEIISGKKMA